MPLVQLFLVENILNTFLVLLPGTFWVLRYSSVAPVIIGMTKHFIFHIHLISILRFLY
jgi:hypothetical protein